MKFTLDFLAKTAGLKDAAKLTAQLGDELDGTESDAEALARAMNVAADQMEADLRETAAMADRLGAALGPELAAKMGQGKIEGIAVKFRDAGMSVEQVEGNINELAAGIKRLDAVSDQAAASTKRIGEAGDQSRSVMANLAGNAISEMPLVAGAIGPVNVALGQLAEYAVDGNIKLKNLAMMAGPMLGVGVAIALVGNHMEQVAKTKAFNRAKIDQFTKALREGATAAEAWDAALSGDDKKIEFIDAATGDVSDFTDELARNGVTWAEFKSHLDDGKTSFDAWARGAFGASTEHRDLNKALQTGWQLMDQMTEAERRAAAEQTVFGDAARESTVKLSAQAEAAKAAKDELYDLGLRSTAYAITTDSAAESGTAFVKVLENQTDAAEDSAASLWDLEESTLAADEAYQDLAAQTAAIDAIMADATLTADEKATALRDLRGAQIDVTQALADSAEKFAADKGAVEGSTASYQLQVTALEDMKAKYPLLANEIQRYIDKLNAIPGVKNTQITLNGAGNFSGGGGAISVTTPGNSGGGGLKLEGISGGRGNATFNVNVAVTGVVLSAGQVGEQIGAALSAWFNDGGSAWWANGGGR